MVTWVCHCRGCWLVKGVMMKSTQRKCEKVRRWVDEGEEIRELLIEDGPEVIERLMMMGESVRGIARKTHLSATYISHVKNGESRVSPTSYLALLKLELKGH